MIEVITKENRESFADLLDQMHRQRYQIFVKALSWNLAHKDQREKDNYDTEDAVYLLALEAGVLSGAIRLIPSNQPHLLKDHFEDLCENGVPIGKHIWEATRAYSKPSGKEPLALNKAMGELFCAVLEFALLNEIEKFTLVASLTIMPVVLHAGWKVAPLGLPKIVNGDRVGAFAIDVSPESLRKLRHIREIPAPVLNYLGHSQPNPILQEMEISNGS